MLKLKLGPHDNNGIIDTYNNGVSSPLSVLCRSSKVSGILSFLKPLYNMYLSVVGYASCRPRHREKKKRKRVCKQNEMKETISLNQSTYLYAF